MESADKEKLLEVLEKKRLLPILEKLAEVWGDLGQAIEELKKELKR